MSHQNENIPDDPLDQATTALHDLPCSPGPSSELLASTLSALNRAQSNHNHNKPSNFTMKAFTKLAIAAVVAVFVGLLVWNFASTNHPAFGSILDQIKQSNSVRFKSEQTVQLPDSAAQTIAMTVTIAG